jgi:hypothetical protein
MNPFDNRVHLEEFLKAGFRWDANHGAVVPRAGADAVWHLGKKRYQVGDQSLLSELGEGYWGSHPWDSM